MSRFISELSGSLIFRSGSTSQASLVPNASALGLTGSLNITGSKLTFNGSDVIQRIVNLEAGSVGSGSLGPLNAHSGSINTFTQSYYVDSASFDSRIDSVESTNSTNSSAISALQSSTSSYFSSSAQLTDQGFLSSSNSSIVSSSAQIASFGFITSASVTVPAGTVSSSQQILDLGFVTGSPDGTISSSAQISALGFQTGDEIGVFIQTGSFYATTNDIQVTGSMRVSGSVAANSFISTDGTGVPTLSSNSNLILSASDAVIVQNALLRPGRFGNSATASLSSQDGDIMYNSSSNQLVVYSGSAWYNLLDSSNAISGAAHTRREQISASFATTIAGLDASGFATDAELSSLSASAHTARLNITASAIDTGSLVTTASFNSYTASYSASADTHLDALIAGLSGSAHTARLNITASAIDTGSLVTTSSFNSYTASYSASADSHLDALIASLSSSVDTHLDANISALSASTDTHLDALISGLSASAHTARGTISGSGGNTTFDGNRTVSNTDMPSGIFNNNFGTSGSIQDFLDAVFFPNTAPSISTGNQVQAEFTPSGSTIVTLSGTDAESQPISWSVASAYTDDYVRVTPAGVMSWNTLATASMNTDNRGDGTLAHPVIVRATDSFNGATNKTIYIRVTPNETPVFRETSVAGNIITSYAATRDESATAGEITKIYFSDAESDTITIHSSSIPGNHFTVARTGSYVSLRQATGSLDYETTASYAFSISASDEHYQNGDVDSIVTLPITITVQDNATPTINNQSISGVNENSSDGTAAGSITATDSEGNALTFTSFTLAGLELDGSPVATGSYGGTSQATDPHEDAFQMSTAGAVTRKAGVYLNSDLVNSYIYSASVKDAYNAAASATVTIPVADDTPATISNNGTFYIIESARSGDNITTNTNGIAGTIADFNANQSVTWNVNPTSKFAINGSGRLSLNYNVSGSTDVGGGTISGSVTASNAFGTRNSSAFTVNITNNAGPTLTATPTTANLNTNGARSGSVLYTLSYTDPESNAVDLTTLSFDPSSANIVTTVVGSEVSIRTNASLSAGVYDFTASVADEHGFEVNPISESFTIAQADDGTLSTNGTFYIIESADSGSNIVTNSNGRSGTQADVDVSWSPAYNSPSLSSISSSNHRIVVDSSGGLTIAVPMSGSFVSGDTLTSTINWSDQYGNTDSDSITVNVAINNSPSASFTNTTGNYNTNEAVSGSSMVTFTVSDTETDTPFTASLSGTDAAKLNLVPQNIASSSWDIQAVEQLVTQSYSYNVAIRDNFGKQSEYNGRSFTIAAADTGTMSTNGTFYVIESATSGNNIVTNSNGRTGTQADLTVTYDSYEGSPSVQSFTSSNALIAVNNSGNLTVGTNISGSGNTDGSTINSNITFTDNYGNVGSGSISVNVTENTAPDIIFSNTSGNLNTNLARSGSTLTTISFSDTESDTILYDNFVGAESAGLNFKRSGNTFLVQPTGSLAAGSYTISGSITDNHGFSTNTESHTFTIAQADDGTISTNGTFYIIESAVSQSEVVTNSNGRTGTQAQVGVTYSPNYGSQAYSTISSSNHQIVVDGSGNLESSINIASGSYSSGDTISTTIHWTDQYGNSDSSAININVTANQAPTVASFTDIPANWTASNAQGTDLVTFTISDTESNTPFSASLSGTGASQLQVNYLNADSSSVAIEAASSLVAGTINYNVRITDAFGKQTDYTGRTITVAAQPFNVYGYGISWAANPASEAQFMGTAGDVGADEVGIESGSIIAHLQSGSLGSTFNTSYGATATVTLYHSSSTMTTLDDNNGGNGVSSLGYFNFSGGSQHVLIVFPSSSALAGKPASMYDGVPPDSTGTDNEFYLYAKDASIPGTLGSGVYYFNTENAVQGNTRWGMIYSEGKNTNNSRAYLMPDSASAP